MAVQFFERRRQKAWFTKAEEEVCWEQWTLDVTLATPRTESGMKELRRLAPLSFEIAAANAPHFRESES